MHCMKCGREIGEDQVFCLECLTDMGKYPVKPGTAVWIPPQPAQSSLRKPVVRKAAPTAEEMNVKLKKQLRLVTLLWVITLLIAAILAYPAYQYVVEENHFLPGQNYSVVEEVVPEG